jgi:hypothetical protein
VTQSLALSVITFPLLVQLYGRDEALPQQWGRRKPRERFIEDVVQEHVTRTELQWQHRFKQVKW